MAETIEGGGNAEAAAVVAVESSVSSVVEKGEVGERLDCGSENGNGGKRIQVFFNFNYVN